MLFFNRLEHSESSDTQTIPEIPNTQTTTSSPQPYNLKTLQPHPHNLITSKPYNLITKKGQGPNHLERTLTRKDGGDLLSRIAVQYHRRARA